MKFATRATTKVKQFHQKEEQEKAKNLAPQA
jgi:hypothetical protein